MNSPWTKTPFANLYRYRNGQYHVRAKVAGHLVRHSLKTKSLEIAKSKLDDALAEARGKLVKKPSGEGLFGTIAAAYLEGIDADTGLKQRSKDYRRETVGQLKAVAPDLWETPIAGISEDKAKAVAKLLLDKYSQVRYNGALQTFRAICELACNMGYLLRNPTREIDSQRVPLSPPDLPEPAGWTALLKALDAHPNRRAAALAIRFLAFTGARVSAARLVKPACIDWKACELLIPPVKYDDKPIRLPIFPQLGPLLRKMLKDHPGDDSPLMRIKDPKRALRTCCDKAGIPRITPHDLRHLFTTRCLEKGVDVKTTAEWLGHKDGGALLLKRYAHLRREHSQRMAKKVKF